MCTQFTKYQENGIFTYCHPCNQVYVVLTLQISHFTCKNDSGNVDCIRNVTKWNLNPDCHIHISRVLNQL